MKNIIYALALFSLSVSCYADVVLNMPSCSSIANGNLTGCFKNESLTQLDAYEIVMTTLYTDGSSDITTSSLSATQPKNFAVVSMLSSDLEKRKIASLSVSIAQGDGYRYQVMPGCSMQFTPTTISTSVLSIHSAGHNNLYCR